MNNKFHVLSTSGLHPTKRNNFNSKLHHINNAAFVILQAYCGLYQRACWNMDYNVKCNFTKVKSALEITCNTVYNIIVLKTRIIVQCS